MKIKIAPLVDDKGVLITSDLERAELLNAYFESVFIRDNGIAPHFESRFPSSATSSIDDIEINPAVVMRVLGKLKSNAAADPDRIPPIFYRKTSSTISIPLSIIFRTFFELRTLPSEWKSSIITPKLKKGTASNPSNYRPISLTCTCCKILESIISAELISFLDNHNLITKHQHE